jgi:hypothetical protein
MIPKKSLQRASKPSASRSSLPSVFQIIFSLEPRGDLFDHLPTIRVVIRFLYNDRHPTIAVRPNRNHHIGRNVANILHLHFDGGFELGGGFARLLHVIRNWLARCLAEVPEDQTRPADARFLHGTQRNERCRGLQPLPVASTTTTPSARRFDPTGHLIAIPEMTAGQVCFHDGLCSLLASECARPAPDQTITRFGFLSTLPCRRLRSSCLCAVKTTA